MTGARVAVAIPAFQAAPYIADVVGRSLAVRDEMAELGEVLVIDDGSLDETAAVARAAGCEVVSHDRNRGKGAALRTAFSTLFERGYEAVVTVDADGQHLPEEIPELLGGLESGVDLVLGTREHHFAGMGLVRRWSNRLSSTAISFAAGTALADVQTGFRIYTRRLIQRVPMIGERFEAESAIVVRAARSGCRIACVPVELGFADGRHTSHYRPWLDSVRIARAVFAARLSCRPVARHEIVVR